MALISLNVDFGFGKTILGFEVEFEVAFEREMVLMNLVCLIGLMNFEDEIILSLV